MSADYWEAGAVARLDALLDEAAAEVEQLALAEQQFRSQMTFELSLFRQRVAKIMKDNRDYEDRCVSLEMKLDDASENLSKLSESSTQAVREKGLAYKERRKELLRKCEGMVESNKEFKQDFEKVAEIKAFDALCAKYPPPKGLDTGLAQMDLGPR
eukprot:TRINITY_DN59780_c0_g1_i1.p1 TRINITY_DN59780_c0_g1~~TRINITY_DN59780_c0_g1_i1.p1  ORF type:complete len:156 (+),score=55.08 TRINITY_DN59780_c0_g1_i1:57-524(+)